MYYHAYSSQATLSLSQPEEIKYASLFIDMKTCPFLFTVLLQYGSRYQPQTNEGPSRGYASFSKMASLSTLGGRVPTPARRRGLYFQYPWG